MGISVEEEEEDADAGAASDVEDEYEIRGVFETILQNNMEQLQWTALSVLLLSFSTGLLATAHELPHFVSTVVSGSHGADLEEFKELVPEACAVSADLIEQVSDSIDFISRGLLFQFDIVLLCDVDQLSCWQ